MLFPAVARAGDGEPKPPAAPGPAQSASKPAASAEDEAHSATARELFEKGVEAFRKGRWDQCRALFLAAWSIKPHRQIAGNLASCEVRLGLYRDAAEHLSFVAQAGGAPGGSALTSEQERLLAQAMAKVGTIAVVAPAGAIVLVDGKPAGQAPLAGPIFVEPGSHVLEARSERGANARSEIVVGAGEKREVKLNPAKEAEPPPPAPPPPQQPPPQPPPPQPPSAADVRLRNGLVIGGLALGGTALITGVVLTVVSNGASSDAEEQLAAITRDGGEGACLSAAYKARCDALDDAYVEEGTTRNLAIASFVTAGVGLGGALAAYMLWPRPPEEPKRSVRVVPAITPWGGGVAMRGTF
jgi:hypothetical protein